MGHLYAEVKMAQLSKFGEELCGDKIEIARTPDSTIIVLSDGLGSGVKANILATLTTKIASSMLQRGISLEDVVNTITETLPICRERKIAYSTFQILQITTAGQAKLVEFDSPHAFLLREGKVVAFPTEEVLLGGKVINIGTLHLQPEDIILLVSDGVIHAGIGGLLKLGWTWEGISRHLQTAYRAGWDADKVVKQLIDCCEGYYLGRPGDDSSVVAVRLREVRMAAIFTGPPASASQDEAIVSRFLRLPGIKIVAGGTTAKIVSRVTGRPLKVTLSYSDPNIPPIGHIPGIDLVTEGVLTLNAAVERIFDTKRLSNQSYQDGATLLARQLLFVDKIIILAGRAVNPAHQNPKFPAGINIKEQVLAKLRHSLEQVGKEVVIEWV